MSTHGLIYFPSLDPPTVEDVSSWALPGNEEALLAIEEKAFEQKLHEVRTANEKSVPVGQVPPETAADEYEQDDEYDRHANDDDISSNGVHDDASPMQAETPS